MYLIYGTVQCKEEKEKGEKQTFKRDSGEFSKSAFLEHEQFPHWCSKPAESKP